MQKDWDLLIVVIGGSILLGVFGVRLQMWREKRQASKSLPTDAEESAGLSPTECEEPVWDRVRRLAKGWGSLVLFLVFLWLLATDDFILRSMIAAMPTGIRDPMSRNNGAFCVMLLMFVGLPALCSTGIGSLTKWRLPVARRLYTLVQVLVLIWFAAFFVDWVGPLTPGKISTLAGFAGVLWGTNPLFRSSFEVQSSITQKQPARVTSKKATPAAGSPGV